MVPQQVDGPEPMQVDEYVFIILFGLVITIDTAGMENSVYSAIQYAKAAIVVSFPDQGSPLTFRFEGNPVPLVLKFKFFVRVSVSCVTLV